MLKATQKQMCLVNSKHHRQLNTEQHNSYAINPQASHTINSIYDDYKHNNETHATQAFKKYQGFIKPFRKAFLFENMITSKRTSNANNKKDDEKEQFSLIKCYKK